MGYRITDPAILEAAFDAADALGIALHVDVAFVLASDEDGASLQVVTVDYNGQTWTEPGWTADAVRALTKRIVRHHNAESGAAARSAERAASLLERMR